MTQEWSFPAESLLTQFRVTLGSVCLSHFWGSFLGHFNCFWVSVGLGARWLHNPSCHNDSEFLETFFEILETTFQAKISGFLRRNRTGTGKPEPSEPFFQEPKSEPEPPETFSRNRNRNRNRPSLIICTETLVFQPFSRETAETENQEPLELFHKRTVTEPNRTGATLKYALTPRKYALTSRKHALTKEYCCEIFEQFRLYGSPPPHRGFTMILVHFISRHLLFLIPQSGA